MRHTLPLVFALLSSCHLSSQELGFQAGTAIQAISVIHYRGYRTAAVTLHYPEALGRVWGGTLGIEWRASRHWGKGVPIVEDQATPEEWQAFKDRGEAPHIDFDRVMVGVIPTWRRSLWGAMDLDAGLGLAWLDRVLITGGTQWSFYLALGLSREVGSLGRSPVRLGLRLEHFSNGGTLGVTKARVIGLESLQATLAFRLPK